MGVIFARLIEEEHRPSSVPLVKSVDTETLSRSALVANEYVSTNEAFQNILKLNMEAAYMGGKECSVKIVTEGVNDMIDSLSTFFDQCKKRSKKKYKKDLLTLGNRMMETNKTIIAKYIRNPYAFEPFTIHRYKYTIPNDILNLNIFLEYLESVVEGAKNIMESGVNALPATVARQISQETGESVLDAFRGKLLNSSHRISSNEFRKQLKLYFRDGKDRPEEISVDTNAALAYCKAYDLSWEKYLYMIEKNASILNDTYLNMVSKFLHRERQLLTMSNNDTFRRKKVFNKGYYPYPLETQVYSKRKNTIYNMHEYRMMETGLSQYFTAVNQMLRNIFFIYDTYLSVKIDAIEEYTNSHATIGKKALEGSSKTAKTMKELNRGEE